MTDGTPLRCSAQNKCSPIWKPPISTPTLSFILITNDKGYISVAFVKVLTINVSCLADGLDHRQVSALA